MEGLTWAEVGWTAHLGEYVGIEYDTELYTEGLTVGHDGDLGIDLCIAEESPWMLAFATYTAPLGVKLRLPGGKAGLIVPRSSAAQDGLLSVTTLVDPTYEGEVHGYFRWPVGRRYLKGESLVQLLIVEAEVPNLAARSWRDRGEDRHGSTTRGADHVTAQR